MLNWKPGRGKPLSSSAALISNHVIIVDVLFVMRFRLVILRICDCVCVRVCGLFTKWRDRRTLWDGGDVRRAAAFSES
jgi:hypothetical protein